MLTESVEHLLAARLLQVAPKFIEREVDDIVMVDLLRRQLVAQLKPDAVKKIDLLGVRWGACGPR